MSVVRFRQKWNTCAVCGIEITLVRHSEAGGAGIMVSNHCHKCQQPICDECCCWRNGGLFECRNCGEVGDSEVELPF